MYVDILLTDRWDITCYSLVWTAHGDFLPKSTARRIGRGVGKKSNFMREKRVKHRQNQVIKVHISRIRHVRLRTPHM